MRRINVTLETRTGPVSMWAYESDTPGLVVHRQIGPYGVVDPSGWTVSHQLSGFRVASAPTRARALEIAALLKPMGNWQRSAKALWSHTQFLGKVRRFMHETLGRKRTSKSVRDALLRQIRANPGWARTEVPR